MPESHALEPITLAPMLAPSSALEAQARAEIDLQVATAKRYPRDEKKSVARALAMATATQDVAGDCFYVLKRKDSRSGETKTIEGGSIRLAEIFAISYGNLAYGFRPIADDGRAVLVEGVCIDFENNLRVTKTVRRNVLDRNGRRYSEDMVTITSAAAGSIACRNAIFAVVPDVYVQQALLAARRTAVGDAKTLPAQRDKAIKHFGKLGIDEPRVLAAIGRATVAEITLEDVLTLRGLATTIREGDATIEETFPAPRPGGSSATPDADAGGGSTADQLARKLAGGDPATDAGAPATGGDASAGKTGNPSDPPPVPDGSSSETPSDAKG